jgi:S-(hydroxymethyl)glutathione dehydrogenase / alcohol dehydrogenase
VSLIPNGLPENVLVHEIALVKITHEMPLNSAALIGCGVTTGLGAVLNTAQIEPGTGVAVFGCGGVGIAAIQGARIAGARQIIAVDQVESKLAMAKRFGSTHGIDASQTDPVKAIREMTGGRGVDYSFEAVGNTKLARQCFESVRRGGTATIIGILPVGQWVEIEATQLLPERKLQGSMLGSMCFRISMPRFVYYYLQGQLNLDDIPALGAGRCQRSLPGDESGRSGALGPDSRIVNANPLRMPIVGSVAERFKSSFDSSDFAGP